MMEWYQSPQKQHDSTWFTGSQPSSEIRNEIVPEWFNGSISRKSAEEVLMSKPPGYFLIRISESRFGYTLSYRAADRCRHFMVDMLVDGSYAISGEKMRYKSLQDLVDFHRRTPIMPFREVLTVACGQASSDKSHYAELQFPQRCLNPTFLQPPWSLPVSQDNALPAQYSHTVLPQNSQLKSLSLCSKGQVSSIASQRQAMPVPKTRKRYVDYPPPGKPPEVPAWCMESSPTLNQTCLRTASAPISPCAAYDFFNGDTSLQERKQGEKSLGIDTNNLEKKFQKKRSELRHAELNMGVNNRMEKVIENEYQEIPGELTYFDSSFSVDCIREAPVRPPEEYSNPPPFAPGY